MDGNRRWAMRQGLLPAQGHRKGFDVIQTIVEFCFEKSIKHVSLYVFSLENMKRSSEELYYLFEVLAQEVVDDLIQLKEKNINITFVGDRSLFPKSIKHLCDRVERETRHCDRLYVHILLYYGSRQEIVDTTRRIATKVCKGDLQLTDVTVEVFEQFLWTANIPYPDLIIRTGGDHRLSNFLLFQAAYTELYFLDCLWPDITKKELEAAVTYFHNCRKNYGV